MHNRVPIVAMTLFMFIASGCLTALSCNAAVLADSPLREDRFLAEAGPHQLAAPFDLGYFKLEAEACTPLGPAQRSVTRLIVKAGLTTAEAAMLTFNWRQIQHHRAEAGALNGTSCYYPAH